MVVAAVEEEGETHFVLGKKGETDCQMISIIEKGKIYYLYIQSTGFWVWSVTA